MYVFLSVCVSHSVARPALRNPMDCSPSSSSVHRILQATKLQSGLIPSPGDLPDPGIDPGPPELQAILYHLSHLGKQYYCQLNTMYNVRAASEVLFGAK